MNIVKLSSVPRNTLSAATDVHASSQGPFSFYIPDRDARAGQTIYPNSKSFLTLLGPDSDDVTRLGLGYVEGNTLL